MLLSEWKQQWAETVRKYMDSAIVNLTTPCVTCVSTSSGDVSRFLNFRCRLAAFMRFWSVREENLDKILND